MKKNQIKQWEEPACNLCLSRKYSVLYSDITYWEYEGVFRIVKCINCDLIFTSPRPTIDYIRKYYMQEYYFGRNLQEKSLIDEKKEREHAYGPVYRIINSHKQKGNILDIGAGTGLFLSYFTEKKWNVDGVEITKEAVLYAKRQYGILLKNGDFHNFIFKENQFDVVVLNGALEHLHNPFKTLNEIRKILKKDGILLFSVPNVNSVGNFLFGRNWFPWQAPRHLYHFAPATAKNLLKKVGFTDYKIDYNYFLQNQYIIFQSIRYAKSSKFQKRKTGGLANKKDEKQTAFLKEAGKLGAFVLSYVIAFIEPLIKKGEVMIVYAKKS